MKYVIRFKHRSDLLWKRRSVEGHRYAQEIDKMILHFSDSKIEEVPEWSKCHVKLGQDFFLAQKEAMEKETGVDVKLKGV